MKNQISKRVFGILFAIVFVAMLPEMSGAPSPIAVPEIDFGIIIDEAPIEMIANQQDTPETEWIAWATSLEDDSVRKDGVAELVQVVVDQLVNKHTPNTSPRIAVVSIFKPADDSAPSFTDFLTLDESSKLGSTDAIMEKVKEEFKSLRLRRSLVRIGKEREMSNAARTHFGLIQGKRKTATDFLIWIAPYKQYDKDTTSDIYDPINKLRDAGRGATGGPELILTYQHPRTVGNMRFVGKAGVDPKIITWQVDKKQSIINHFTATLTTILQACPRQSDNSSCFFKEPNDKCIYRRTDSPINQPGFCPEQATFEFDCSNRRECESNCLREPSKEYTPCDGPPCGYGKKKVGPEGRDTNEFLKNCPLRDETCRNPNCDRGSTLAPAPPGASRPKTTRRLPTSPKATPKTLEVWQIVLIVLGSVTFMTVGIAIVTCCVCKRVSRRRLARRRPPPSPSSFRSDRPRESYGHTRGPTRNMPPTTRRTGGYQDASTRMGSRPPPRSYLPVTQGPPRSYLPATQGTSRRY